MAQAIVHRTCARLRSAMEEEAVVRLKFSGDMREMLEALEVIQSVLDKAEMRPLRDRSASEWLWLVRAAAYKILDMVDELQGPRSSLAYATMLFLDITFDIKMNTTVMLNAIDIKVEDTKKTLMVLKEELHMFVSAEEDTISQEVIDEQRTGPYFKEALVFGRKSDKQRIMAVLGSAPSSTSQGAPSCTILPIFGIAGSGKTTMAQMVFNDTHSLQDYNFRVWVHVSPKLDFHEIGESILSQVLSRKKKILCQVVSGLGHEEKEINNHGSSSDIVGMGSTMERLHKLLRGTRVLLVLDDLWEEDPIQLQRLKLMSTSLGHKMDVIVTTCNKAIARNICTVEPYLLNPLGDDTCWEIIKKSIRLEEEDEELEKTGREIANKCWGVPSAARAYASMLDSRDPTRWKEVMERNIWKNISSFRLSILLMLATFELSYKSMPPDLRLCFAYCAIFPNGHNIVKNDLILQWIALHLIEPSDGLSTTEIAEEYITRLLDISFLQTAKSDLASGNEDKGVILFTMHGLAHEFARWFVLLDYIYDDNISIRRVHYKLILNCSGKLDDRYDDDLWALRCVGCSKVKFNDDSFSFRRCLRVLELKESSEPKLPDSICQLRHLRYLKISEFSGLVTLPESFGRLINLFHIDLSDCSGLVNLPKSFGNLIHLVHVGLSGCSGLVMLPGSFGKLVNVLHINLSGCSGLLCLPDSFGKLVKLVHINLSGCSGLATLPESFKNLFNLSHIDLSHCYGLSGILETLQKLDKLVYLDLSFWSSFQGIKKCLGGLTNLQHLNLSNPCCYLDQHRSHLQELKDVIGKLTELRYLNLSMCLNPIFYFQTEKENLEYVQLCIRGLSSLEHLDLSHNIYLVDLPESLGDLNELHTLDLSGCLRLKSLGKRIGKMRSLKLIVLKNCQYLESCHLAVHSDDRTDNSSSNLVELEFVDCKELEISCLEMVRSLEEAQRIRLVEKQKLWKLKLCWTVGAPQRWWKVDENALLGELVPPHTLRSLVLKGYNAETFLPTWWSRSICSSNLLNIVEVTLEDFPRCTMLPQLGLLPNLKLLVLRRMGRIKRLDDIDLSGGNRAAFSRLYKVTIEDMEKLEKFMFPGIPELVFQKCPELRFGPLPPRAQRLVISDCNKVMSSWGERQGGDEEASCSSTPVTELVVENYNLPLDDSGLLHHLPGLHSLTIRNSHGIISLPEYLSDLTSLRELTIQSCHGMESLLQSMEKLTNLDNLYILDCPGLRRWCESGANEAKLAHIRPKYEKPGTSGTGDQQLHMQTNLSAASLAQGAERALVSRRSLRRQATKL